MKLAIDLGRFRAEHHGGKDEVAYNLLRGFSELGLTDQILCICLDELVDIVHAIDPRFETLAPHYRKFTGLPKPIRALASSHAYGTALRDALDREGCTCLLYADKPVPPVRMNVPTVLLPHDILPALRTRQLRVEKPWDLVDAVNIWVGFRQCDRIIAISDFDKSTMWECFPRHMHKVVRIYDPIRFKDLRREGPGRHICALNIQWPHKNTLTLVKAYAQIADQTDEKLLLVGRKNFTLQVEQEIDEVIRTHHLEDRVEFTGFVDDEELSRIISQTRLYVNPSLWEGFGMTAVEMMGCGTPTIVCNATALPESTLGLCGYYGPGTDASALAAAMLEELRNPTPQERLDEAARLVREKYDYVAIAQQYWELLSSLQ